MTWKNTYSTVLFMNVHYKNISNFNPFFSGFGYTWTVNSPWLIWTNTRHDNTVNGQRRHHWPSYWAGKLWRTPNVSQLSLKILMQSTREANSWKREIPRCQHSFTERVDFEILHPTHTLQWFPYKVTKSLSREWNALLPPYYSTKWIPSVYTCYFV